MDIYRVTYKLAKESCCKKMTKDYPEHPWAEYYKTKNFPQSHWWLLEVTFLFRNMASAVEEAAYQQMGNKDNILS